MKIHIKQKTRLVEQTKPDQSQIDLDTDTQKRSPKSDAQPNGRFRSSVSESEHSGVIKKRLVLGALIGATLLVAAFILTISDDLQKQRLRVVITDLDKLAGVDTTFARPASWKLPPHKSSDLESMLVALSFVDRESQPDNISQDNIPELEDRKEKAESFKSRVTALLQSRGQEIVEEVLLRHFSDNSKMVQDVCYDVLRELRPLKAQQSLAAIDSGVVSQERQDKLLSLLGPDAVDLLIGSPEHGKVAMLMKLMTRCDNARRVAEHTDKVISLLKTSDDPFVRCCMTYLLALSDNDSAKPAVCEALKDSDVDVRIAALSSLGVTALRQSRHASAGTVRLIASRLKDKNERLAFAAIANLAALEPSAIKVVESDIDAAVKSKYGDVAILATLAQSQLVDNDDVLLESKQPQPYSGYAKDRPENQMFEALRSFNQSSNAKNLRALRVVAPRLWGPEFIEDEKTTNSDLVVLPMMMRNNIDGRCSGVLSVFEGRSRCALAWMLVGVKQSMQTNDYETSKALKSVLKIE